MRKNNIFSRAANYFSLKNLAPLYYNRRAIARINNEIAINQLKRIRKIHEIQQRTGGYIRNRDNTRDFEVTSGSRKNYGNRGTSKDANSYLDSSNKTLKEYIRDLEYNNGNVSGPIQRIANHVVGTGLKFQSRVKADPDFVSITDMRIDENIANNYNYFFEKYFNIWNKKAGKRMLLSFYEIQKMAEMSLVRDGAAILVNRTSKNKNRIIPHCIEVLEIDRLQTPLDLKKDPDVIGGIKYDDEGVPETYFIAKNHPGNTIQIPFSSMKLSDFEEIPAYTKEGLQKVIHLFNPMRPEQTQGFSKLAAGLKDIELAVQYQDAEFFSALQAACTVGIVTSNNPNAMMTNSTINDPDSTSTKRLHEFEAGTYQYLAKGEDIKFLQSNRPNNAFAEVIENFYRGPANGLDIPIEVFMQNWRGLNYSNARTILIQFYYICRIRQDYLANHLCFPIMEWVARDMVAYNFVQAPFFAQRRYDYLDFEWIPPKKDWVDPVKEPQGKLLELQMCSDTYSGVSAANGRDFENNAETNAKNLAYIKKMEEKYDISFPSQSKITIKEEKEEEDNKKGADDADE